MAELRRAAIVPITDKLSARVLFIVPQILYVLDSDPNYQQPDVPLLSRPVVDRTVQLTSIEFPPVAWFVAEFARRMGGDPVAELQEAMEGYSYNWQIGDAFARAEAVQTLAQGIAEFESRRSGDDVWVTGELQLNDYDPTAGFQVSSFKLAPLPGRRTAEKAYEYAVRINPSSELDRSLNLPVEEARTWKESAKSFLSFAVRARIAVVSVEQGASDFERNLTVDVKEVELLDKDAVLTARDPRARSPCDPSCLCFPANPHSTAMMGSRDLDGHPLQG